MDRGSLLKSLREKKQLSQTEAARHAGISKQTLYKYENNIITNIPYEVIERLSVLYETNPSYIMGWEDEAGEVTPHGQLVNTYVVNQKRDELYKVYEGLSPEKQAAFEAYLKFLQSDS